ncbi:carbon-nitrogen hydrolase family protein [Singulisphaera sp. PoT]|uniref:carbon-nitrogen hydrolase family protein n=1 Tax=Singulisphaera sp. PoT TaxID=3411797 RepID=UPI003BF4EDC5
MSEPKVIRAAGVQMDVRIGEVEHNLSVILEKINVAADDEARLVVFPECALTGYGFESREEALPYAQTIPGPSTQAVAQECSRRGVWAIYGLLERDGEHLYNACALVGPDGVVGAYRKVHLPFLGVDRFTDPGDRPFEVHEVDGLRVGMHICYDGAFPESARVLGLLGADLIVLPTNWPPFSECAAVHMVPCRAFENVVFAMAVNRVGEESGFRFIGRSSVADPRGTILAMASPDGEEIIYADIDPARSRQKRIVRVPGKHEVDRIGDRRPGFYRKIVEPNGRN